MQLVAAQCNICRTQLVYLLSKVIIVQSLWIFDPFDKAGKQFVALYINRTHVSSYRGWTWWIFNFFYDESIEAANVNKFINFLRLQFLQLNETSKSLKLIRLKRSICLMSFTIFKPFLFKLNLSKVYGLFLQIRQERNEKRFRRWCQVNNKLYSTGVVNVPLNFNSIV